MTSGPVEPAAYDSNVTEAGGKPLEETLHSARRYDPSPLPEPVDPFVTGNAECDEVVQILTASREHRPDMV